MRISTSQIASAGLRQILQRQADVQRTQLQLSTQLRVLKPSDDPVAATAIDALQNEILQLDQFNLNANAAKANGELEEGVLASVTQVLFRVRELMVSAGNGVFGKNELSSIAVELQGRLDELVGLANTQNANGDYLFSGSLVGVQSFTQDIGGNIIYNGDQNQRLLRISSGVVDPISDPGFDVFVNSKNGNGFFSITSDTANTGNVTLSPGSYQAPPNFLAEAYSITFGADINGNPTYTVTGDTSGSTILPATLYTEGETISFNGISVAIQGAPDTARPDVLNITPSASESVFSVIQKSINALSSFADNAAGRAQLTNSMTQAQQSLDNNMINIDITRGKIGTRLNTIDSETNSNLSLIVISKSSLSDVRDLDMVEAATRFSQQISVLEAAQASFARVQNLNLFNFI